MAISWKDRPMFFPCWLWFFLILAHFPRSCSMDRDFQHHQLRDGTRSQHDTQQGAPMAMEETWRPGDWGKHGILRNIHFLAGSCWGDLGRFWSANVSHEFMWGWLRILSQWLNQHQSQKLLFLGLVVPSHVTICRMLVPSGIMGQKCLSDMDIAGYCMVLYYTICLGSYSQGLGYWKVNMMQYILQYVSECNMMQYVNSCSFK